MNFKVRLLALIALILSGIGFGSLVFANLTNQKSNPSIAQTGGMNYGGMNHGGMNHNMDVGPADANYDLRFIDSMIPHHQGALVMAQEVLQKSKRPELIKLAKGIVTEQKKEIAQMQQWLLNDNDIGG